MLHRIRSEFQTAWAHSALLTFTAVLMTAAFLASAIGIFVDDRIITGAPAWLKPAKFGISSAIYAGTVAWLLQYVTVWPKAVRLFSRTIALTLILEVAIIDMQAARGATSHFNAGTPLDTALFGIMGTAILVLWLASLGIAAALFRQRFPDVAWGWALRLGMLVSVLGAGAGGFMLGPNAAQKQSFAAGKRPAIIGAHTVGAPDGGPGLPGVGWSTEHGDLRIPHFLGLHAIQVIPFLAFLMRGRRRRHETEGVFIAAAGYLSLIAILTWQALRGQSIVGPDAATLTALGLWAAGVITAVILWNAQRNGHHAGGEATALPGAQGGRW